MLMFKLNIFRFRTLIFSFKNTYMNNGNKKRLRPMQNFNSESTNYKLKTHFSWSKTKLISSPGCYFMGGKSRCWTCQACVSKHRVVWQAWQGRVKNSPPWRSILTEVLIWYLPSHQDNLWLSQWEDGQLLTIPSLPFFLQHELQEMNSCRWLGPFI